MGSEGESRHYYPRWVETRLTISGSVMQNDAIELHFDSPAPPPSIIYATIPTKLAAPLPFFFDTLAIGTGIGAGLGSAERI